MGKVAMACRHTHVAWPQSGWQACLDCGARRPYPAIGEPPGEWITGPSVGTVEIDNDTKPDIIREE